MEQTADQKAAKRSKAMHWRNIIITKPEELNSKR